MLRNVLFIVVGVLFSCNILVAQDFHTSQFFNSPLNLNPALTGIFNGDARVHANYKEQWSSVPVGYTFGDLGFDRKHRTGDKGHFLGYGALLNYDRAGDLDLGWTGGNAFLSYSLNLGETSFITPGVTVGYYQRGYNPANASTANQWSGKTVDPNIQAESIGAEEIDFVDVGIGLNYRWQKNYRKHLDLGLSLAHINSPTHKFKNTGTYSVNRPSKLSAYGMLNLPLVDNIDLLVNAMYAKQNVYEEIVLNLQGKIYLSSSKSKALFLGIGTRLDDAIYPMIALQMGQLYGAFSYDLNNSAWDLATDRNGGPELSLRYIWAKVPEKKYEPCLIY